MAAVITDKNDQEVYLKQAGDDEADQTRYGSVGCASVLSTRKQSTATQHSAAKVNRKAEEQTYEDL
jgi:hypothetical protein